MAPAGTLSLVASDPPTGTLILVTFISGLIVGTGSTNICKVAFAHEVGVPPHTSYKISTGPLYPAVGVNV